MNKETISNVIMINISIDVHISSITFFHIKTKKLSTASYFSQKFVNIDVVFFFNNCTKI